MPVSTTAFVSGLSGAVGGRFVPARGDIVFVELAGRVSSLDPASGTVTVLGNGYVEPVDVVATSDGSTLLVAERGGTILKVDPNAADRADASPIISGLGAVHQMVLMPDDATLYFVEHGPSGRLARLDLGSAAASTIVGGLAHPMGVAVDASETTAYVTEQGPGQLTAVDLATAATSVLVPGLTKPAYLTWHDTASTKVLLLAERDPANRLSVVDLTAATPFADVVATTPHRPSSAVVVDPSTSSALVLCDAEIVLTGLSPIGPGLTFTPIAEPLFVGGYQRVPYTLTGGLTPDDIAFWVPDGAPAGAISPSRDARWDDARPHVMLLGGHTPGRYKLVATETATGTDLDAVEFEVTAEWVDQASGPPIAFVGESEAWVTGGAWGGGPGGVQNFNVMPATGTRRVAIILVDTSSSRFPTTGTAIADASAEWANELMGTTADPDGVFRSAHHYFQEVSDGRFDVSLAGGAVVGPVSLPNAWTSYFDWNTDRSVWWANGNYFQAVVTAAQDLIDFDNVDTIVAVVNSLTASVQMGTTLFGWPVAGGGNFTYHRPGQTANVQRVMQALNMPVDWEAVDGSGRRNHETLSHEIGHNLGLPDLYMNVTGFDAAMQARDITDWDLMSWENPLPHVSIAAKMMLGWVDATTVRAYNFANNGGGVDDTFDLQASGALAGIPAGRSSGVEVRRADGWNYYFEYRRGQAGDIGDRQLASNGAVIGTDVVSGTFAPPQARRSIVRLLNDPDGDGPVLTTGLDYEEPDPSGPAHFSLDVLATHADRAEVRVRYGAGGRPDPSIRPWPGGNVWKSPDIEVRNAKSDADGQWLNVPWAGHSNRVVAKITNGGDFIAKGVRANFFVKDFTITNAPESPLGSATHDIAPGATVEFETLWTPPANTPTDDGHYCIVVRIPLYQDPGNPAIVELTELNNIAQSNYTRFISSSASPSSRGISHVAVHNPFPDRTRAWVVATQDSDAYRTYLANQWVWLDPGETRRVEVMYESLLGDPAFAATVGERREAVWKRPSRLALVGLMENPLDEQLHVADPTGGVSIEVASGRGTRIDPFDSDGKVARGRVTTVDGGQPVTHGAVVVTVQLRGRSKGEASYATTVDSNGYFVVELDGRGRQEQHDRKEPHVRQEQPDRKGRKDPKDLVRPRRGDQVKVQAEYLGSFSYADSRSRDIWVDL